MSDRCPECLEELAAYGPDWCSAHTDIQQESIETWLRNESESRGIRAPQIRTLKIYGIDELTWLWLLASQGWKCAICQKSKATWNTDHEHVPGWKKLPPEERVRYVRGILCWHCNRHVVNSNLSAADGRRLAAYLEAYEARRDGHSA